MLEKLLKSSQITIIEGERKTAKLTFTLYALKNILQKDAIILTPIEQHLFKRKIKVIQDRFESLENVDDNLSFFILKDEWNTLKKRFSYEYFQEELEKIFQNTERQVIVFHRFGLFFEFQDRFEIEPMFRKIIDIATEYNKQVIFTIATSSINYDYMNNVMCDFSDFTLEMREHNLNERSIHVMDSLESLDNATYYFKDSGKKLLLEEKINDQANSIQTVYRVLLVTYENQELEALESIKYLMSRREIFQVTYVSSIHEVLQQVLLDPDLLFFFLDRKDFDYEVFKSLKEKLPESLFFVFFSQEFIRSNDKGLLHEIGINDVFGSDFQYNDAVVSIEKTLGRNFYFESLKSLDFDMQYLQSKQQLHTLMKSAYDNMLYFSLFIYRYDNFDLASCKLGRDKDCIYVDQKEHKIYYLALNTRDILAHKIGNSINKHDNNVTLLEACSAANIERCFEM